MMKERGSRVKQGRPLRRFPKRPRLPFITVLPLPSPFPLDFPFPPPSSLSYFSVTVGSLRDWRIVGGGVKLVEEEYDPEKEEQDRLKIELIGSWGERGERGDRGERGERSGRGEGGKRGERGERKELMCQNRSDVSRVTCT